MINRKIIITGAFFGAMSVVLGAWAAHGLKLLIPSDSVISFETGVRYQMYHSLFLIILGMIPENFISKKARKITFYLALIGIICFSFSIYLLATNSLIPFFDFKKIALITPMGGLFFIATWLSLLFFVGFKKK